MTTRFSSIDQAIEAIRDGLSVIVVDAEDREDEGDFVAAAERVTAETVHFMISHGRGLFCMPILPDVAERLQLTPMVDVVDLSSPRFTVPVDHRSCKTGISPAERAYTVQSILEADSKPSDFIRPGHIFPLVAQPEGLLRRPGHTEAAVDLARLAGLTPAGVLCEICSCDGKHMACRDELHRLAGDFGVPIITIDALTEVRRRTAAPARPAAERATTALTSR